VRNRTFLILRGMMIFFLCADSSITGWLVTYLQNKLSWPRSLPRKRRAPARRWPPIAEDFDAVLVRNVLDGGWRAPR
jgi:hypothetical protein